MGGKLKTALTEMLGVDHPVMLAGMGPISGHEIVAAVSNAGGFGTLGLGAGHMVPEGLRKEIRLLKESLRPPGKFGVDILIPQVGGNARKTNHDYTGGNLPGLVDVMIEEGCSLFVCAVGVPPQWVVDKLHSAGIPVMNMVGAPHHVLKALEVGVDMVCAQGTEAGGHTGTVATVPLVPQVVDLVRGRKNFFGKQVPVVAAGGIFDGRGLAAALALGASGIWVGTRFLATPECNTSPVHRKKVLNARSTDVYQTILYTGRPCRGVWGTEEYTRQWEESGEIDSLCKRGVVPFERDLRKGKAHYYYFNNNIMGQAVGGIKEIKPAAEVVAELVNDALEVLDRSTKLVARL
uniref:Nitronate monooxygenase domain-containing protein n=1 Tax=Alexandrium monilatum TaxID=311494 RepID=A0A7S4Q2F6_9DINO|mmetsp:Transcript_20116/g.63793  ORF Transcript_20116/g.63793 Transcript_20116/m.63793 type:complete len:349 (+) Transcript_20116:112-1158(+)